MYRNLADFKVALGGMTYGDLHGRHITFSGPEGAQPYKHALAFHVSCSADFFLVAFEAVGAWLLFTIV